MYKTLPQILTNRSGVLSILPTHKCKLFVNTFWAYQNNEKRGCIPSLNCAEQLVQPGHLTVLPEEKVLFWNEHNSLM
jgi:hypothetical protein